MWVRAREVHARSGGVERTKNPKMIEEITQDTGEHAFHQERDQNFIDTSLGGIRAD